MLKAQRQSVPTADLAMSDDRFILCPHFPIEEWGTQIRWSSERATFQVITGRDTINATGEIMRVSLSDQH